MSLLRGMRAVLLVGAGVATAHGAYLALRNHVPLGVFLGAWALVWIFLLCASAAAVVIALVKMVRRSDLDDWGSGVSLRVGFVCLTLGWITFLFAWQPFEPFWFDLWFGLVAGVFAGTLSARRWILMIPAKARRIADFTSFNLCLAVVLAEFILRIVAVVAPSPLLAQVDTGPWQYMESFRLQPGQIHRGFPANSRGHYDDDFGPREPGQPLVAVIGDSFSVGAVPHSLHYTTVCEQELPGVRVDNYGIAAIGPREYQHIFEHEVLPNHPDLVIVSLFAGNDLEIEGGWALRAHPWLRSWFDLDNVLSYLLPKRLRAMKDAREASFGDSRVVSGADEVVAAYPWVEDPRLERPSRSQEAFIALEQDRAMKACRLLTTSGEVVRILREMRDASSVPVAVMLIPDEFQVEDALWEEVIAGLEGEPALDRYRPQREILDGLEAAGIPALDLLPALRSVDALEDRRLHVYHSCDTHFNARGNRVAGQDLAQFIRPMLPAR